MSPSFSMYSEGKPWTICSLTEAQIEYGKPLYPLNVGSAPASRIIFSAARSISIVVMPGFDQRAEVRQHLADQLTRGPHLLDFFF